MDKQASPAKVKTIVVLPAFNAAKTLEKTVADIPKFLVDEIILVDDYSQDQTLQIAKTLGLKVFEHPANRGYGANQKTCYRMALEHGADIIIMIHPDYQYDPKRVIPFMTGIIENGICDVVLGNRIRTRAEALAGGMPVYKYYSNRLLTFLENLATGYNLSEWHTGMRAYKKEVLQTVDFENNSDDFVFDSQMLFQIIGKGYRVGEIPVPVRYRPESSNINFSRSLKYGIQTLWLAAKYWITHL